MIKPLEIVLFFLGEFHSVFLKGISLCHKNIGIICHKILALNLYNHTLFYFYVGFVTIFKCKHIFKVNF